MTLDCILQMGYIKTELMSACSAVHGEERKNRVSPSGQGLQKKKGVEEYKLTGRAELLLVHWVLAA